MVGDINERYGITMFLKVEYSCILTRRFTFIFILLQLVLQAYDSVFPYNKASAIVHIYVQRNGDVINFINANTYSIIVNEYEKTFKELFRVSAVDPDGVSFKSSFLPEFQCF